MQMAASAATPPRCPKCSAKNWNAWPDSFVQLRGLKQLLTCEVCRLHVGEKRWAVLEMMAAAILENDDDSPDP